MQHFLTAARSLRLVLAGLSLLAVPFAASATTSASASSLIEHRYYDCDFRHPNIQKKKRSGRKECQVFYSIVPNRIAVKLKNPQAASRLPELAAGDPTIGPACCPNAKALELMPLGKSDPKIAIYKVKQCQTEPEILWLANQISRLDGVEAAGALGRRANAPGEFILLDQIVVEVGGDLRFPFNDDDTALLTAAGLSVIAPEPFNPEHGALLDVLHQGTSSGRSFLDGLDVLTCVATHNSDFDRKDISDPDTIDCSARNQDEVIEKVCTKVSKIVERCGLLSGSRASSDPQTLQKSLGKFWLLEPRLVRPLTIPIATASPSAEFKAWLKNEKKSEDGLNAKFTFNSVSNSTASDDQAKLSIDATASRGTYPSQTRLNVGAQVVFDDDEDDLEENVTRIRLNYDHYLKPWMEVYGFVERFTNNFLAIDQRWEGGGGVLFEYDKRSQSMDRFCASRGLGNRGYTGKRPHLTRRAEQRMAQYREMIRHELLSKGFVSTATAEEYCRYQTGIEKRHAVFQASIALSVFSDLEQPAELSLMATEIDANGIPIEDAENPDPITLRPESDQMARVTVRPVITLRPTDDLTFRGWYYYKYSLEDSPGGDTDYRSQAGIEGTFALTGGSPRVSLKASFIEYHDSNPPRFSLDRGLDEFSLLPLSDPIAGIERVGMDDNGRLFQISGLTARGRHEVVTFGVEVKF